MKFVAGLIACIVFAVAGCGGGSSTATTTAQSKIEPVATGLTTVAGKQKPVVSTPGGRPPTKLVIKELKPGKGRRARVGDKVKVEFVSVNWHGETSSDSWIYSSPPVFDLGGNTPDRLVHGLDLGVRGMRAGGRREVIVPSTLVFWPDEEHVPVDARSSQVFVVDLLAIG